MGPRRPDNAFPGHYSIRLWHGRVHLDEYNDSLHRSRLPAGLLLWREQLLKNLIKDFETDVETNFKL